MNNIRIALVQDAERESKEAAFNALEKSIAQAAQNGAKIICTQELFPTPYFCRTQDPDLFDLADEIPGPGHSRGHRKGFFQQLLLTCPDSGFRSKSQILL